MYKSRLQELCQQRKWRLPDYNTTKVGLDHIPRFSATVTINGLDFHTVDIFRSSKEAQNDAAKLAFHNLSDHPQPKPRNPIPGPSSFPQPRLSSSSSASSFSALPSTAATDSNTKHEARQIVQPKIGETHQIPQLPHQFNGNKSGATSQDAEHAAAKAALMSLLPNGVQEDDSGLFKNLLQELIQKEGFSMPVYSSRMSGEHHMPVFVSSVEIKGETFMGQEAKSKKQAELSAAKVAYHTLRECTSSQLPLVLSAARKEQEASEILSSSFQSKPPAELHQQARPNAPAILSLNTNTLEHKKANVTAEGKRQHSSTASSVPCTPTSGGEGFSSSDVRGRAQGTNNGASTVSQNGSTNCVMDSSLEPPAKRSAYNKVSVYLRKSYVEYPEGTTMLPMSDETWVACSHT